MSEFVDGFDRLSKIGPCVSIFGSARSAEDHPHYKMADELAFRICEKGYGVITGGGPGIMEAANRGAQRAGGKSVGLNINLPFEQHDNPYIDREKLTLQLFLRAQNDVCEVCSRICGITGWFRDLG